MHLPYVDYHCESVTSSMPPPLHHSTPVKSPWITIYKDVALSPIVLPSDDIPPSTKLECSTQVISKEKNTTLGQCAIRDVNSPPPNEEEITATRLIKRQLHFSQDRYISFYTGGPVS